MVTGLGVIAPNGIGKEAFWSNLVAGKSAVDYITAFDPSPFPCKVAAEVKNFHPTDFVSERKTKMMGRFSHFAVAATRLALEDSNLSITPSLSRDITICYGTSGGADVYESATDGLRLEGIAGVKPWAALEYPPHATSTCISIEFQIKGPALSVSSNCCTGLDTIYTGFSRIVSGNATAAIVGSCEAPITPIGLGTFCALKALTSRNSEPEKASRPYDLLRDGLVIGEGAASLILEDVEFALNRGANIYGEVLGYGAASESMDMRKGDLSGAPMATAILQAVRNAALSPCDIDHVNAHGSSLPDFDVCDSNAFKQAFGQHAFRIPITSIKSMMGQPFSAAGTLQTVAACLAIKNQHVPPTINQEVPDPRCDLDYVANKSRVARVKRVLINAHSFGGSVSTLVIGKFEN
ncbi:MAG: beta-ketoacyl-[acyl-carrier-protein] synthase family protein [Candidatus Methylomirabilia bacterium]